MENQSTIVGRAFRIRGRVVVNKHRLPGIPGKPVLQEVVAMQEVIRRRQDYGGTRRVVKKLSGWRVAGLGDLHSAREAAGPPEQSIRVYSRVTRFNDYGQR